MTTDKAASGAPKRPRGLAARKAAENASVGQATADQRIDQATHADHPTKRARSDVNASSSSDTLVLELPDNASDMDEVEHLLGRALASKAAGLDESALALLRGCVHECDKLVRIRAGALPEGVSDEERSIIQANAESLQPLTPSFYFVFATSLMELGLAERDAAASSLDQGDDKQDPEALPDLVGFVDAALDRFETGLDLATSDANADPSVVAKLNAGMGRAKMYKAMLLHTITVNDDTGDDDAQKSIARLLDECNDHYDKAVNLETASTNLVCDVARYCNHHVVESGACGPEDARRWTAYARALWARVLETDLANITALVGMGSLSLSEASEILETLDSDTDTNLDQRAQSKQTAEQLLHEATNYLRQAVESDTKTVGEAGRPNIHALCLLGEACVQLGNLLDTDTDDDEEDNPVALSLYAEAISAFKRVLDLDANALPSQFAEFVEEWENDVVEQQHSDQPQQNE